MTGRVVARAKPLGRRLIDRVAMPYVEETVCRVNATVAADAAEPGAPSAPLPVFAELHAALHEARSLALADMPPGADTLLSAGASGSWYFNWVEREYGAVDRHIGVEAYLPRPEALPANAEWVDADIASPEGVPAVPTRSVDLVFSGQNFEHLWPDQMLSFLVEANRVLRDGGWLVVDSPNRTFTGEYQWSMGEHTVELTPSEAQVLLEQAGFSVEAMKGVWLCRDDGRLLSLEPDPSGLGPARTLRRMAKATQRPEDSFIWWAEGRRVGPPDVEAVQKTIAEVFEEAWAERVARVRPHEGTAVTLDDGRPGVEMEEGRRGYVFIGPWMALVPGRYEFEVEVAWDQPADPAQPVGRLEVLAGEDVLGAVVLPSAPGPGSTTLRCPATVDGVRFAVHVRFFSTGVAGVRAPLTLRLLPEPWRARATTG